MSLSQDLRFATRVLAKDRWFTLLAALVLAFGIGAASTVFTMLAGIFLHPVPFERADRLAYVDSFTQRGGRGGLAFADFEAWRASSAAFADMAAYQLGPVNVSEPGRPPEQLDAMRITANLFGLLGQRVLVGRGFAPGEDASGAPAVAILSHRVWQARYGADARVLGRTLLIDERPTTIVGVMPEGMQYDRSRDLWVTVADMPDRTRRDARAVTIVARLRDHATIEQARAELEAKGRGLAGQYGFTESEFAVRVTPFRERLLGSDQRTAFGALGGAVAFVLLIACGNVANLLLAKSGYRRREVAVRLALGADRWAIVRQFLVESVLLALLGGALGFAFSIAGVRWFGGFFQTAPDRPFWVHFTFDAPVFLFLATVSIVSGVGFGLAPAWQVSGVNVTSTLQEAGPHATGGVRGRRLAALMVVVQLAMTMMLLAGANLLVGALLRTSRVDVGARTEGVLVAQLRLTDRKYPDATARRAFYDRLEERLAGAPGLVAASVASEAPLEQGTRQSIVAEGGRGPLGVLVVRVGPRYFETLGVRLRRGRAFEARDGSPGREVVIVSEPAARAFFGDEDPTGRRIGLARGEREGLADTGSMTIVGVAPAIRQTPPFWQGAMPAVYVPFRQDPQPLAIILARGQGAPSALAPLLRREVGQVDPNQPLSDVMPLDDRLARWSGPFRVFGIVFAALSVMALVMSAAGMYGIVAWTVSRRQREIGVRMALGAGRGQVAWLFARQAIGQVAAGFGIGLPGAIAVGVMLRAIVLSSPVDPVNLLTISAILVGVTLAAVLVPSLCAARLDPMAVLRKE
jgi:putative ABC transport system permease protein